MRRRDWLLILLLLPGSSERENEPMDRVRIVKTLFLLGRDKSQGLREFYEFRPYLYGPFSPDIYADLENLIGEGYVAQELSVPRNWGRYRLTSSGVTEARRASEQVSGQVRETLEALKKLVTGLSFLDLLRHVYKKYPEFAQASVIHV